MKLYKTIVLSLIIMVIVCSVYRIVPGRPYGFAPQWAMAIFAGAVIRDRKWAFIIPVLSMFLSDLLYQALYNAGISTMPGFYVGQWQNYILFGLLALVGMAMKKINVKNILVASLAAPTIYFFLSNFLIWESGAGYARAKTASGLMQCYTDGLPFYGVSLAATIVFSALLFGSFMLIRKSALQTASI
jgi:hypothetical protein